MAAGHLPLLSSDGPMHSLVILMVVALLHHAHVGLAVPRLRTTGAVPAAAKAASNKADGTADKADDTADKA